MRTRIVWKHWAQFFFGRQRIETKICSNQRKNKEKLFNFYYRKENLIAAKVKEKTIFAYIVSTILQIRYSYLANYHYQCAPRSMPVEICNDRKAGET